MAIGIERAVESDLPDIVALLRQPDMSPHDDLDMEAMRRLFARLDAAGAPEIYVARDGAAIVGTFSLTLVRHLSHNGGHSLIAEDVVVAASSRGRGVGRAMMTCAMRRARELKCYKLVVSSNLSRETAHAFYEKVGFRKHGYSFVVPVEDAGA
jgi:GNAT superfamily N-acetyltransferase